MDLQGGGGGVWPATAGFTAAPEPRQRHDRVRLPACHLDLVYFVTAHAQVVLM